uniref:Uncharacterized protein n=1 Tax=Panagrolaimus sp. PS1159 TaxID=55785 RepID=A0AC35FNQ9_9BILA
MPEETVIRRQVLDKHLIDEIEKTSTTKCYEKIVFELQNNPTTFSNFKILKKIESNVYHLAKDYLDKLKKNTISHNQNIYEIANRFVEERTSYEIIRELGNPDHIKNKGYLKLLIEQVKDCVESAYQLANHREKTRTEANFEQLKETLARIERDNARRERKFESLLAQASVNQMQMPSTNFEQPTIIPSRTHSVAEILQPQRPPSPSIVSLSFLNYVEQKQASRSASSDLQNEASNIQLQSPRQSAQIQSSSSTTVLQHPSPEISQSNTRKRTRTIYPSSSTRTPPPKLRRQNESPELQFLSSNNSSPVSNPPPLRRCLFVSNEDCLKLKEKSQFADHFIRKYLPKLLSPAEQILPLKELPSAKKDEFIHVCSQLYGGLTELQWEEKYNACTLSLRNKKRGEIFKLLKKSVGYGITSNGKHFFYKISTQTETQKCYKTPECVEAEKLQTHLIGNYAIPEQCGRFGYVVLMEKEFRMSKIQKLFYDGKVKKI